MTFAKFVPFLEVCDIQGGTQPPKSTFIDEQADGHVRLLQIQDFKSDKKAVFVRDKPTLKKCTAKDIMIARYGASLGKILSGHEGAYNVALVKTIPDLERLDRSYFAHFLRADAFQNFILNLGGRAAQAGFNKSDLERIEIPLPPLEEQKRIAGILDQADALRRLRTRALEKLNTLGQAIFHEMFEPVKGRTAALKDLGRVQTGSTPSTNVPEYFIGEIPFVTPGDLESDRPFQRFVSEEGAENSRTVKEGATFVCCIGATIGKMGMASTRSAFNQQINSVEWRNEILPEYGYFAMQMIREDIIHIGKGAATTLPILKKSLFEKMEIRVASIAQQEEFISRYEQVSKLAFPLENGKNSFQRLFASLQHRAFRGEL